MAILTWHWELEWAFPRMVQLGGAPAGQKWALWGTGKGMCPPGRGPPQAPLSPWGQEGGGPSGAAPGGLAVTGAPSRQPCSQRLAAKAASALLTPGLGEGDVQGLEAEGPGLGHLRGLGGRDGRAVAEGGAEAWRRAVVCCGGEARRALVSQECRCRKTARGVGAAPGPAPTQPEPWSHC